jgi:uncharacterized protein YfaS (alpha-2-macroglobulin family)
VDIAFSEAMDSAYIRQDFKDTAFFRTITLDDNGTGKVTLELPDNVTSWRVTMAGLTTGLHGGTGKAELNVSLPFFINHSINSIYLAGDDPCIGVAAYGDALEEGDTVTYQLTCPQRPGLETTIRGKAFERVTIPLWQMEEGSYDIVVKALSETGDTDGFMQTIQVVSTYHEIEKAVYGDLKAGMRIPAGSGGMTTLLFSDRGRGGFLPMLYSLAYGSGNRIDQKFAAKKARDMITAYYEEAKAWYEETEVNLADYRNSDGGFGILPYAESDLRTTALVTPLVAEEIGSGELRKYYYGILFNGKENVKPAALYGMAVLGEPVLLELDKAAAVENMKIEDYIFIALAYAELGEYPPAEKIFVERVLPLLEQTDPYVRVKAENRDLSLRYTALAAVLASKLDRSEKDGMYRYVSDNNSGEYLVNLEKLLYIENEIENADDRTVEIKYTYDGNSYSEVLESGRTARLIIPSRKISDLRINKVTGDASVVSIFSQQYDGGLENDENLVLSREYYKYGESGPTYEFLEGDIVKVVIEWNIEPDAIDRYYEITDYAPSGMKPIDSPWQMGIKPESGYYWYRDIDGQKVTFHVSRDSEKKEPLVYYARIVSPGTYTAEASIIQGTVARESARLGEKETVRIGVNLQN